MSNDELCISFASVLIILQPQLYLTNSVLSKHKHAVNLPPLYLIHWISVKRALEIAYVRPQLNY